MVDPMVIVIVIVVIIVYIIKYIYSYIYISYLWMEEIPQQMVYNPRSMVYPIIYQLIDGKNPIIYRVSIFGPLFDPL